MNIIESPGRHDSMTISAPSAPTRKRGRPPKSLVPVAAIEDFTHDLIAAGAVCRERDATLSALLARIQERTANCFCNTPLVDVLAQCAGISSKIAGEVISGHKPFTTTMLNRVALSTGTSAHWLLTGEGSIDPNGASAAEDERQFLIAYRNATPLRKRYGIFVISFDGVMRKLPRDIRNRVLSGLLVFAESGQEEHEWMVNAIGRCMTEYCINMTELIGLEPLFTPVHEVLGIFGPERPASLATNLSQPCH